MTSPGFYANILRRARSLDAVRKTEAFPVESIVDLRLEFYFLPHSSPRKREHRSRAPQVFLANVILRVSFAEEPSRPPQNIFGRLQCGDAVFLSAL